MAVTWSEYGVIQRVVRGNDPQMLTTCGTLLKLDG